MHIRSILHGQFRSAVLRKLRERDRAACSETPGVNSPMRARERSKGRYTYVVVARAVVGTLRSARNARWTIRGGSRFCSARKTDLPNDRH